MIGRKAFLVFISRTITRFFESILYIIAINIFAAEDFGLQKIVTTLMAFFVMFSTLGLETPHLKIMAKEGKDHQNQAYSTFLVSKIGLMIIATSIVFLMYLFQINEGLYTSSVELNWIFLVLYVKFIFYSFNRVFNLSFRAKLQVARTEIPSLIASIFSLIFSLIVILIFKNFLFYMVGQAVTEGLKLGIYMFSKRDFHFTKFSFSLFKQYLILSIVFLIAMVLNTLRSNWGVFFFLEYFDRELLGVFSVISSFFIMIKELEKTFSSLFIPNFTKLIANQEFGVIKNQIEKFDKYMLILNGLVVIGGIIFAKYILKYLLGNIYLDKGLWFFLWSLLSLFIFPLSGSYLPILIAGGKMKNYIIMLLISFLISLSFWIIFIPVFNIIAIDMGSWIAGFINVVVFRWTCFKHFKIGNLEKNQLTHLIVLSLLVSISFGTQTLNLTFLNSILITIILFALYIAFLFISKILGKKDIAYILDALNPKKMSDLVKSGVLEDS